jgi:hypothetical protein
LIAEKKEGANAHNWKTFLFKKRLLPLAMITYFESQEVMQQKNEKSAFLV